MKYEWVKDQNGAEHLVRKSNENFEIYYGTSGQRTCRTDAEWEQCLEAMRRPLPQGFRLNASRPAVFRRLRSILERLGGEDGSLRQQRVRSLPWGDLPGAVWQLAGGVSRWDLRNGAARSNEDDEVGDDKVGDDRAFLGRFHSFLLHEGELGNLSRQELVSQVPVLLLDIRPDHRVLDICASPGSKTKQAMTFLHHHEQT